MPIEQLRKEWTARASGIPLNAAPVFEPGRLTMGSGTVLVGAVSKREFEPLAGQEARVLTLLATAYRRAMPRSVLKAVERATKCWAGGDYCLAQIHLALAGLHSVDDQHQMARRLFMAEGLMKAGIAPETILQALELENDETEVLKLYDENQPRVPQGSGETSGRWVKDGSSVLEALSEPAEKFLLGAAARLAGLAIRGLAANPVTLTVGLVLIPHTTDLLTHGEVPEIPGLRYAWNRDETLLRLSYATPDGIRDIAAELGADNTFRDGDRVVARLLPDGTLAIDPAQVSSDLADKDGPNLCPTPEPDKAGRVGTVGEKDKDYEDQIKQLVNPDNPTPRGYGYRFYNPETGRWVYIDDCQHQSGMRVEIKGNYDGLLSFPSGRDEIARKWLDQSGRQLAVSKGWPLLWVFSQAGNRDFARDQFDKKGGGRMGIGTITISALGKFL